MTSSHSDPLLSALSLLRAAAASSTVSSVDELSSAGRAAWSALVGANVPVTPSGRRYDRIMWLLSDRYELTPAMARELGMLVLRTARAGSPGGMRTAGELRRGLRGLWWAAPRIANADRCLPATAKVA